MRLDHHQFATFLVFFDWIPSMAVLVMPLVMAIGAIKPKIIAMANGRINMAIMGIQLKSTTKIAQW